MILGWIMFPVVFVVFSASFGFLPSPKPKQMQHINSCCVWSVVLERTIELIFSAISLINREKEQMHIELACITM